jgi:hypothetical protein
MRPAVKAGPTPRQASPLRLASLSPPLIGSSAVPKAEIGTIKLIKTNILRRKYDMIYPLRSATTTVIDEAITWHRAWQKLSLPQIAPAFMIRGLDGRWADASRALEHYTD